MRRILLPQQISEVAPPRGSAVHRLGGLSMGTSWTVLVAGAAVPQQLQASLQQQLDSVVAEMSHWEAESDLGRYNRAPPGSWLPLPPACFDVLSFAMQVAHLSGGAYDPCAGAIVNAWGFGPSGRHDQPGFVAPSAARIAELRAARAAQRLLLAPPPEVPGTARAGGGRAYQPGGVQLDLSAVAKGYSVDRLAHCLTAHGLQHFLVEVGGELRGAGLKPDGQPWWVALEQPPAAPGGAMAGARMDEIALALHGLSVATSGDYRRYFLQGGERFAHTIDPRSAAPITNRLASVTVVHPHCMAADAWSTALTVLGPEQGLALAERQGLAARFVLRSGPHGHDGGAETEGYTEYLSSQMRGMLDDE
ncbi:thiamine biosynthesis protein ApbE [Massilia sp. Root351]|uniref:FAD:protein FMN transferase n=1 Tax=Massilia sp. Root351 TaxID=1736522 RepID=UPI000708CB25|nr:FAD:protein FMN transferase [Massilia sp. Root351]KQV80371.1 thiamine biosynthesis protein ApbE [Massilia sp. Root351]